MEENKESNLYELNTEKKILLSTNSVSFLSETGKWAQFLAILGFIGIGFILIAALFMSIIFSAIPGSKFSPYQGVLISIIYILFALIYFFPVRYLYLFSTKIKTALSQKNETILENALESLKSHYKFIGILTIIMLSLYILFFIGLMSVGIFTRF